MDALSRVALVLAVAAVGGGVVWSSTELVVAAFVFAVPALVAYGVALRGHQHWRNYRRRRWRDP